MEMTWDQLLFWLDGAEWTAAERDKQYKNYARRR